MGAPHRVVLVSNRLPPAEDLVGDSDVARRQVSGLVSAIRPALGRTESLWFGWSGRTSPDAGVTVSDSGSRRMVALDLPAREAGLYYTAFSNRTLWPLLHNFPDRINVRTESYSAYRKVNRRFAESLLPHLRPGDTVWVHDFHLFPLGALLREMGWPGKIGFFLHVPFPSVDTFSILPWARELLEDLLVYDLVGLQTRSHARNLMSTLVEELRGAHIGDAFVYGSRRCRIGVYPVGADPETFRRLGAARPHTRAVAGLRRLFPDQKLVLGVDRLDYTKGVPERLATFERLLERRPSLRGRIGMVQISVPSRERVPEYASEKRRTDEIVGRINGRFSRGQWIPGQLPLPLVHAAGACRVLQRGRRLPGDAGARRHEPDRQGVRRQPRRPARRARAVEVLRGRGDDDRRPDRQPLRREGHGGRDSPRHYDGRPRARTPVGGPAGRRADEHRRRLGRLVPVRSSPIRKPVYGFMAREKKRARRLPRPRSTLASRSVSLR